MSDFIKTLLSAWVGKHSGWNIFQIPSDIVAGKHCQPRRPISLTIRSLFSSRPQQTNTGRIELIDATIKSHSIC